MKQIRTSIFETNSSSTHVFCLTQKPYKHELKILSNEIIFKEDDINYSNLNKIHFNQEKLNYIIASILIGAPGSICFDIDTYNDFKKGELKDITDFIYNHECFSEVENAFKLICECFEFDSLKFFSDSPWFSYDDDDEFLGEKLIKLAESNPIKFKDDIKNIVTNDNVVILYGDRNDLDYILSDPKIARIIKDTHFQ